MGDITVIQPDFYSKDELEEIIHERERAIEILQLITDSKNGTEERFIAINMAVDFICNIKNKNNEHQIH